jgi:hypothetical protein
VVLTGGTKLTGTLEGVNIGPGNVDVDGAGEREAGDRGAGDNEITISYTEKQKPEGKKRPEIVTVTKTFALGDIKTTKELINFK